jgi:putative flippase GtrA
MKQLFWFGVVGVTAMLVHLGTVSLMFVPWGIHPLTANVLGFLIAFQVSHAGHRAFTFTKSTVSVNNTRLRFFAVAAGSFLVNEALFAALLHFTTLDYRVALAIVLVVVAALTFFLARNWAFAAQEAS